MIVQGWIYSPGVLFRTAISLYSQSTSIGPMILLVRAMVVHRLLFLMAFPVVGSTSMVVKFKILRRPKVIREELTLGFSLSATPGKHDGVQERVQQFLSI